MQLKSQFLRLRVHFLGCDLTFGAENLNFKGERRAPLQESFLQMTLRDGQKLPNEA